MSKRSNRKYSISRRLGECLWGGKKDPQNKKNYPPGMHGPKKIKRITQYGQQLLSKQKIKNYYGNIKEKQFFNIYKNAKKYIGNTSENIIKLLEIRLDSFIYRCKFAPTIFAARQYINHKHFTVNGIIINIPSYRIKINDIIKIRERSKKINFSYKKKIKQEIPEYIDINNNNDTAILLKIPKLSDIPVEFKPHHIIEFYSK